jgi:hypothetical protein
MYFVMKWRCFCVETSGFLLGCGLCWSKKNVLWAGPLKLWRGLQQKSMGWAVFNKQN